MSTNSPSRKKKVERRPFLVPQGQMVTLPTGKRVNIDGENVINPDDAGYDAVYETVQARYNVGIDPPYADSLQDTLDGTSATPRPAKE